VLAVGHIDLAVGSGNGVLHHHLEELRIERIFFQREFGGEASLVADDGVEAPVRHRFRLVVERLAHVVVGGEAVHELHGLRWIDVGRLPTEPDIEIDHVVVRLEIELLDVVDIGADHDLAGPPGAGEAATASVPPLKSIASNTVRSPRAFLRSTLLFINTAEDLSFSQSGRCLIITGTPSDSEISWLLIGVCWAFAMEGVISK